MPPDPFTALGWAGLHERLAELRAGLDQIERAPVVDLERYREVRRQLEACVVAIGARRPPPADRREPPLGAGMPPRPRPPRLGG